jgi:DNA-binding response OmpR family regulator
MLKLAREQGFKGIVARTVAEALRLAQEIRPNAVTLDLLLGEGDGWSVLSALKDDPELRHVPVAIISVVPEVARGRRSGAKWVIAKPTTRPELEAVLGDILDFVGTKRRSLLIVADDEVERQKLAKSFGDGDVNVKQATGLSSALAASRSERFDCVLIEPPLSDTSASKLIASLRGDPSQDMTPIVLFSPSAPEGAETKAL